MANILNIDDNKFDLLIVSKILEDAGHHVISVINAKTARELLQINNIDLIITDLVMPFSGLSFLLQTRSDYQNLPIIVTSGEVNEVLMSTLVEHGADVMLKKPLSAEILIKYTENLLNHGRPDKGITDELR